MSLQTKKAARQSIARRFDLPPPDAFSQYWEDEVSEPGRIVEFLKAYASDSLTDVEKTVLMGVILNSYTDLDADDERLETFWPLLHPVLAEDRELLRDVIVHYAQPGEPEEDSFPCAARLRIAFPDIVKAAMQEE